MTKDEKKKYVADNLALIAKKVNAAIDEGRIPETWDGHELSVYLADKFDEQAQSSEIRCSPHGKRAKAYNNTIAVTTL